MKYDNIEFPMLSLHAHIGESNGSSEISSLLEDWERSRAYKYKS